MVKAIRRGAVTSCILKAPAKCLAQCYDQVSMLMFFRPNMAVKGTRRTQALSKVSVSSGLFIVLVLSGIGVGFLNESLRPQQELNKGVAKVDNAASNPSLKRDALKRAP